MTSVFRLVLRTQVTRGRAVALGAVGVIGLLLAVGFRRIDSLDRAEAAYKFIDVFGLGLLVPVTALVFASAALGDPAEDATLVYLWLRPVARWRLALAALAASWCATLAFAVAPVALAAALTGVGSKLVVASVVSCSVAVGVYGSLFVGLGLLVRRALVWGLAYVLIWEGFVSRSGTSASRLSVLAYGRTMLAHVAGQPRPRLASSIPVAVAACLFVAVAAFLVTTWSLSRAEVA